MARWLLRMDAAAPWRPDADKFVALVHGQEAQTLEGGAAACHPLLAYEGLASLGLACLSDFELQTMPLAALEEFSVVVAPGSFACGEAGEPGSGALAVYEWLAQRSDLVLMVFDVHKLDPCRELVELIEALRPHRSKLRFVLNKADQLGADDLVRAYGALYWSLGQLLRTPEVPRVLVGSFRGGAFRHGHHRRLFEADRADLRAEVLNLKRLAGLRRASDLVARTHRVKAHYAIACHLRAQLPRFLPFGAGQRRQRRLVQSAPRLLEEARVLQGLSQWDVPEPAAFARRLEAFRDVARLPRWNASSQVPVDRALEAELPELLAGASFASSSGFDAERPDLSVDGLLAVLRFRLRAAASLARRWLGQRLEPLEHLVPPSLAFSPAVKLAVASMYVVSLGVPSALLLVLVRSRRRASADATVGAES